MSTIEVKVPDIGDFKDVPVIEVLVKPGDVVKADDPLVTLESDKATMEVPSPVAGTVRELKVKVGDKVAEGVLILTLESAAAGAPSAATPLRRRAVATAAAPPLPHRRRRPPRRSPARRSTRARPTSSARCWCWARGRAATARRSAPPTSA